MDLLRTFFAIFLSLLLLSFGAGSQAAEKPNVILFLVDDMGWMDSTPYGSQYYETPNMARLANRGMLFTDAYACPLCSPTRASIMTGKYSARHGITSASGHQPPQPAGYKFLADSAAANRPIIMPESKNYLEPSEYTLAEALRDAGYHTAHIGKWHLGLTEEYWPERQGFQVALHGKPDPGPASYFSPGYYKKSQTFRDGPPGEYITDRLTDEAVRFIDANRQQPFFLNLWHHGVHGPWGFKKEYADAFVGKKDPRGKQANPIMAAMLKSIDESLGRILDKLDALKIADNTIIIFYSDNGGNTHSNSADDPKLQNIKPGDVQAQHRDNWEKYAKDLTPTNNAPLRDGKGTLYEGGIRVPLMIAWPAKIAADSRSSAVVGNIDLYPTILELLGLKPNPQQLMDGISVVPALKQTGPLPREALFTYFPHGGPTKPPGVAVRVGDWKLIRRFETSSFYPEVYELFDLRNDLGETTNLADKHPDKVKVLDARIDRFFQETHALLPKPNPNYQKNPVEPAAKTASAKTNTAEIRYDGWVARSMTAQMRDGFLVVTGDGKAPFLGTSGLKMKGPVTLRLRTRGAGGPAKVQWRTVEQETFPATGQTEAFEIVAGKEWSEKTVTLPIDGVMVHVRVYIPAQKEPIEIDRIELKPATGLSQTWEFK